MRPRNPVAARFSACFPIARSWIDAFEAGLKLFRPRRFAGAVEMMNRTNELRGESDGPAAFYLRRIAALDGKEDKENWDRIVGLSEK